MNIKNYILIGVLCCFLLNSNYLYSQNSEIKGAPITQLKAKKRVVEQFVDIFLEYDYRKYTSGEKLLFMSIIQESEKTYNVTISASDFINEPIFWIVMSNCYRFQPFVGKWQYNGFDLYLYGNGIDDFFKPYKTTIISDKLFWIMSLENQSLCLEQPNEFNSYDSNGQLLTRYSYVFLNLLYKKRKISVIFPAPIVHSFDDITDEENKYYNSFSRIDTLTLKQFKSKIINE